MRNNFIEIKVKNFGSKCQLSDEFLRKIASKSGIVDRVLNWIAFKDAATLEKTGGKKQNKIKGLPKLDDANNAGTKDSINCTLILTEGDSAKTLAVAGLGVIGRDRYGVFPLRGKMLNVREATTKCNKKGQIKSFDLRNKVKFKIQDEDVLIPIINSMIEMI